MFNEEILLESKAARSAELAKVENPLSVLQKVKAMSVLPDNLHVTVKMCAEYYEVSDRQIERLISDNRDELELDGLRVITKQEAAEMFVGNLDPMIQPLRLSTLGISKYAASITVIPLRGVIRIGMLLQVSEVAKGVRTALLDLYEVVKEQAPVTLVQSFGGQIEQPEEIEDVMLQSLDVLKNAVQTIKDLRTRLNAQDARIERQEQELSLMRSDVHVTSRQMACIRQAVNNRVTRLKTIGYEATYQALYTALNLRFNAPSYREIPRIAFEQAITFIQNWKPSEEKRKFLQYELLAEAQ